jgi:polar amino acid transport system substrate-binding protein
MQFLIGAPPINVVATPVKARSHAVVDTDSVFITLQFADGSNGCIAYLAEGDKSLSKERMEVFGGGRSFVLDDFRSATFHDNGRIQNRSLRAQDKGQAEEVKRVCEVVRNGGSGLFTLDELVATSRATFRALDSLRTGLPQSI